MKLTKRQLKQIIKEEIEGLSIDEGVWDKIKGAVGMGPKTYIERSTATNLRHFKSGYADPPVPEQLWDRVALALAKFHQAPSQGGVSFSHMKKAHAGRGWWAPGGDLIAAPITQADLDVLAQAYHDAPDFETLLAADAEERKKRQAASERERRAQNEKEFKCKKHGTGKDHYWNRRKGSCYKRNPYGQEQWDRAVPEDEYM